MTTLVTGDGRTHVTSSLMRESLVDRAVVARTGSQHEYAVMPNVLVVGIGGHSIFDRGRQALLPLVEQLAAHRARVKAGEPGVMPLLLGVGGGTRVRHTIQVALDLGIPVGGVAQLVGAMEECNAVMLNALLARNGSIVMQREHFWELPLYLQSGMMPIVISIPPYHFWEPPPEEGVLPTHGGDFGLFMHAEVLGAKRVLFVKDVDGLHDRDPKVHADAKPIRRTTLNALLADMPAQMALDRQLFTAWKTARHVQQVQLINGLVPGQLTAALAGEPVGTIITRE